MREGAQALGRQLLVLKASTVAEIGTAFATLAEQRANAAIVGGDPFYTARAQQLAVLAARHGVPMIASTREMTAAGGLISYGNSVTDAYRRAGLCVGRLLKGAKPADVPIDRATKFELVINLGTAKALECAGDDYYRVHQFADALSVCPRGHSYFHEDKWHQVFCFREKSDAEKFQAKFGGEWFDPARRGRGKRWQLLRPAKKRYY